MNRKTRRDGGSAFPQHPDVYEEPEGMSLLDWFAGMIAQGDMRGQGDEFYIKNNDADEYAQRWYHFAGALIRERERLLREDEQV